MESLDTTSSLSVHNPWVLLPAALFVLLLLFFLVKFFSVFFEFVQAKGCLTLGLISLVGLPGIFALTLISGYTFASSLLILLAVVGVVTGYIARDSEEEVGKFGKFLMIVSLITLVVVLLFKIIRLF